MEYINRNGTIRWQISTYIQVIHEQFSLALTFSKQSQFNIFDLENVGKVTTYNIRSGAIRWQIPINQTDGDINVCIIQP